MIKKIDQPQIPFEYEYDTRGNIVSEKRGDLTTTYAYDALGQLIRVNDPHENVTRVYEYDHGGNMTRRVQYAYTTGALGSAVSARTYAYDANWKDQLIANGPYPLTYDVMGNLKTYADWVYEWEAGRRLRKQTQNETVVAYDYDPNGMRTRKVVSNTSGHVYATYNYTYNGSRLVHMTKNSDDLHFFYDSQDRPVKVEYNGAMYTYLHNLQGDIVGILDSAGILVVEYRYNAWGTILSRTGSMANTLGYSNPFRYRGYIYDDETWMYWVKSRYYYPELHRFINADVALGQIAGLKTHNAYEYCYSDPICYSDPSGNTAADAYNFYLNAAASDGPFLPGDVIGVFGALCIYLWGVVSNQSTTSTGATTGTQSEPTTSPSPSPTPAPTARATIAPTSTPGQHQEYFPENPLHFKPFGLMVNGYPPNAVVPTVIKWSIPGTKISLFEWNYDAVYGSHYHVMLPSMNNEHLEGGHYKPGDMVPEPWNSLFFGDTSGEPWLYLK